MRPTLVDILETYFSKEELKTFLEEAGLKKSGTKRELAERLVNESNYDPAFLLSRLTKEDLLWILEEEFGLSFPRSTKKQELIDAILNEVEEIPEGYDRRQSYEMTHTRGNRNLEKAILKSLKIFKPYRFEKESELEGQLVVHLRNTIEGAEITPQKAGAKRGDAFVPDIVIENFAVEIKFFKRGTSRAEWDRSIGQAVRYYIDGKYDKVFLFVVDHAGIVPEEDIEKYEELLPWLKVIISK